MQQHGKLLQQQRQEYEELAHRRSLEHEQSLSKLKDELAQVKVMTTEDKRMAARNSENMAMEVQRSHNSRVEALLARIDQHEQLESEAMKAKAVAEAALLEVQSKLSTTASARKVRFMVLLAALWDTATTQHLYKPCLHMLSLLPGGARCSEKADIGTQERHQGHGAIVRGTAGPP